MKISELLGKPLISLAESSVEGILKDVIFDDKLKKAKYLILFDDKIESEEKVVAVTALFSLGNDALVIKSRDCVSPRESLAAENNNPASKTVFTVEGKVFGRITDIVFDERLNVVNLELDRGRTLPPSDIAAFSDEMLIIYDGKKIKISRPAPKPTENDRVRIVSTQPIAYTRSAESDMGYTVPQKIPDADSADGKTPGEITDAKIIARPMIQDDHLPQRIIGNYGFLLGRNVVADIVNQRGAVIVKKDTVISPATVEDARKYGRLVELTLHSLSL